MGARERTGGLEPWTSEQFPHLGNYTLTPEWVAVIYGVHMAPLAATDVR